MLHTSWTVVGRRLLSLPLTSLSRRVSFRCYIEFVLRLKFGLYEPMHVLTDRAAGRTPRNVFATFLRYARGSRLCDPSSTLFLGSGTVAGTGDGPVA